MYTTQLTAKFPLIFAYVTAVYNRMLQKILCLLGYFQVGLIMHRVFMSFLQTHETSREISFVSGAVTYKFELFALCIPCYSFEETS